MAYLIKISVVFEVCTRRGIFEPGSLWIMYVDQSHIEVVLKN